MRSDFETIRRRIEAFEIDELDSRFTFTQRLARENGWSQRYAARVVTEYKRFVFLAVEAGHIVSPSDEVDQAWHLHLTYTRSYWDRLCGDVLQRPLHHNPTKGGDAEAIKFRALYEQTLESYRRCFDEMPPADIWPDVATRFAPDQHQRVDTARHWIVPKSSWPRWPHRPLLPRLSRQAVAMVLLLAGLLVAGCEPAVGAWNPFNLRGPDFLVMYVGSFVSVCVLAGFWRRHLRQPADGPSVSMLDLDPCEIALLARNARLTVNAAIASLIHAGALKVCVNTGRMLFGLQVGGTCYAITRDGDLPSTVTPLERAVHHGVGAGVEMPLDKIHPAVQGEVDELRERLVAQGLLLTDVQARIAHLLPALLPATVVVFGLIKIGVGILRDKPVGILAVLSVIAALVTFAFLTRPNRSRYGDRVVADLERKHAGLDATLKSNPYQLSSADLFLAIALFGLSPLSGGPLENAYQALVTNSSHGGGGGGCSTGGCGGGGCGGGGGGGCGGCGGCGG